jgi:ketosteroid isomerase-like protein
MKRFRAGLLAAALLIGMPVLAIAGELEDKIAAAYSAWDAAFNSGDAKAVAAFYADNATLLPADHEIIEGPAGVEKFFAGLFANGVTGHKLEMIKASGGEGMLVGAAKWSAQGKDANGAATTFGGVATHVFIQQSDGSLKLLLHTFN